MANATKQDLIQDVTCATGIVKSKVRTVVEQFFDVVAESLAEGNTIELRGFGTFACKERKARPARNPRTGETVYLDSRSVIAFKFSSEVKDAVAQSVKPQTVTATSPERATV